jgi:hypothetical protein
MNKLQKSRTDESGLKKPYANAQPTPLTTPAGTFVLSLTPGEERHQFRAPAPRPTSRSGHSTWAGPFGMMFSRLKSGV